MTLAEMVVPPERLIAIILKAVEANFYNTYFFINAQKFLFTSGFLNPASLQYSMYLPVEKYIQCLKTLVKHNGPNFYIRRHSGTYFKHKYSKEIEAAVNKQIKAEQQASQDYLSIAVYFLHPCVSRPGAGGFFMRMYEEEVGHMQDFVQYQLLRGGTVCVGGLDVPKTKVPLSLLDAFQKALEMERSVTELLENIVKAAESVKDYQCADFVTSVFLAEQMRSLNEMSQHVTKLSRLCDEHAMYHYDLELMKNYPYTYKSKSAG